MWSTSLRRVDLRLACLVGGVTALLNALLVAGFAGFAIKEGLEEEAAQLGMGSARLAAGRPAASLDDAPRGLVYRVLDPAVAADNAWPPDAAHRWHDDSVWTSLRAGRRDVLVRRVGNIEAALPLHHFCRERAELIELAALVTVVGTAASIGFGVFAARRALGPVRAMAAAVGAIEPSNLAARVPDRDTSDDVDVLARSINAVLARVEWSFGRLESFSADVAHELRSPINRVLNQSQLALLDGADASPAATLASIHETAEQMAQLVNQLLLLASGEEGRLRLVCERVELGTALASLVELYAPLAESLGKSLELGPAPGAWECDRRLVERALANAIENALVHSEAGAKIRIVVAPGAAVGVLDSGPGIPVADRERAFERFVRLDAARHGRGSGLGLAIVRMIARLHGGDCWIESSPLGGAALWMRLPPA
jgi:two-component system heavy metal sensor histidine kinase CusS